MKFQILLAIAIIVCVSMVKYFLYAEFIIVFILVKFNIFRSMDAQKTTKEEISIRLKILHLIRNWVI